MSPAVPDNLLVSDQPHVGFVHQRGVAESRLLCCRRQPEQRIHIRCAKIGVKQHGPASAASQRMGKIHGNVLARQQLEIQSLGQLIGDCSAQSIDIKEGAVFEGRSNMLKSAASPSRSPQPGTK